MGKTNEDKDAADSPAGSCKGLEQLKAYHRFADTGDNLADSEEALTDPGVFLVRSSLPENPRQAAILLAARQKNHRPLADVFIESRDMLIPKNWSQETSPSAVTVATTKAKGPTACTKRQVMRLIPHDLTSERPANVMELAIKWEAKTPPSSPRSNADRVRSRPVKPAEKTLQWLYNIPGQMVSPGGGARTDEPVQVGVTEPSRKTFDSAVSSRGSSSRSIVAATGKLDACAREMGDHGGGGRIKRTDAWAESDRESGYNSPCGSVGGKVHDLEPIKVVAAAAASAARRPPSPPKNHFMLSSTFAAKMNESECSILPEYPLQRRSPRENEQHQQQRIKHCNQVAEYPLQRSPSPIVSSITPTKPTVQVTLLPDQQEEQEPQERVQPVVEQYHNDEDNQKRSRPCVACQRPPSPKPKQTDHFKAAFKAGKCANTNTNDLQQIVQRRQLFQAPKPIRVSSYGRNVTGTLVPPLSAACRYEPPVEYPDFKRLNSTYRMSYGDVTRPHRQRHRPKTLTALINEKQSRIWRN